MLALGVAVVGACQTSSTEGAAGGQGGILLSFGAADSRDCAGPLAGEGGLGSTTESSASASCPEGAPVDYTTQIAPILATCRGEVCHDFSGSSAVAAFIGAPADECCNQRELIAPGHPERSYLVDKLQGRRLCYGTRMPQNRGPLAATDVALIEAWICQGAMLP